MSGQNVLPHELEELANEVGEFICYWGFKKVHGRLWTHVYLAKEPLDAGQLMQRLRVSKALVSLSINDLLRFEVIVEAGKSVRGTQTYVANPNLIDVIFNVLRRRERKMLARTESAFNLLAGISEDTLNQTKICSTRLRDLGNVIQEAQGVFNAFLNLGAVDFSNWSELTTKPAAQT